MESFKLEKFLTKKNRKKNKIQKGIPCEDHLGNKYPSQSKRAEKYGLYESVVRRRLQNGWSLKDALTIPLKI